MNIYFNTVKKFYDMEVYSLDDVKTFVKSGKISKEEFTEITDQEYENSWKGIQLSNWF